MKLSNYQADKLPQLWQFVRLADEELRVVDRKILTLAPAKFV